MSWAQGLMSAGSSAFGSYLSYKGQKEANETNKDLANQQMAFQADMSGTAYQRVVQDMAKAGINPMLATQTGGASTPSGAMATTQNASAAFASTAYQGAQIANLMQGVDTSKAQAQQMLATSDKLRSETVDQKLNVLAKTEEIIKNKHTSDHLSALAAKTREEVMGAEFDSRAKWLQTKEMEKQGGFAADVAKRKADSTRAQLELAKEKAYSDYYKTPVGKAEPYVGLGTDVLSSAAGVKRAFSPQRRR